MSKHKNITHNKAAKSLVSEGIGCFDANCISLSDNLSYADFIAAVKQK